MWLKIADILLNLSVITIFISYWKNRNNLEYFKKPTMIFKVGLLLLLISALIFLIIIVVTPVLDFILGFKDAVHESSSQIK